MEEMLDDALNVDEDEEVEVEADEEVEKVLFELTNGKLGQAGTVNTELPVCIPHPGRSCPHDESRVGCSSRRGASREGYGTLQGAAQRLAQQLGYRDSLGVDFYHLFPHNGLHIMYCTLQWSFIASL
jgi:hypothetical protein